jgi:hypothetical protein
MAWSPRPSSKADDLAAKEPAKLAAMKELFTIEAAKNNVFPHESPLNASDLGGRSAISGKS